jgi:CarD family transcriptional regulator
MTTRKKATKKPLSRPSKAAKRPSKSISSAKSKGAKATKPARKAATRTAKSAQILRRAAAPKTAARGKAKSERATASRAATSAKASAKELARRKAAAALKLQNAARAAAKTAAGSAKRKVVSVAKKKVESVRKGHDRPSAAPEARKSPVAAAVGSQAVARELPKAVVTPPAPEPAAPVKAVKPPVPEKPAAPVAEEAGPKAAKAVGQRQGFKTGEFIVYPAHGVGQIVAVEEQEVAGFRLELFVITFVKDKMTLRVPTAKVVGVGMRKLAEPEVVKKALDILLGRARIKRTMWSRRAQEYETKINSGDLAAISEVVRDLYRSEAQPEQSYSERQLYEAALDRLAREVAVVQKLAETEALKAIEAQLQRGQRRGPKAEAEGAAVSTGESEVEEAA